MAATPHLEVDKVEFFRRLEDSELRRRFGVSISERRYRQWVDAGLALPAKRCGNQGLRPRYLYTFQHYRRALEIARLHALGIKATAALTVHLFLRQQIGPGAALHEALQAEARKAFRRVRASVRSGFLDSQKQPGPKQLETLLSQLGPLDHRLKELALQLYSGDLLAIARAAVRDSEETSTIQFSTSQDQIFGRFVQLFGPEISLIFPGLMQFEERDDPVKEKVFLPIFDESKYVQARVSYQQLRQIARTVGTINSHVRSLSHSLNKSREWPSLILITLLILQDKISDFGPINARILKVLASDERAKC